MAAPATSHALAAKAPMSMRNPTPQLTAMDLIPNLIPSIFRSITRSFTDMLTSRTKTRKPGPPTEDSLRKRPLVPGDISFGPSSSQAAPFGLAGTSASLLGRQKRPHQLVDGEPDSIPMKRTRIGGLLHKDEKKARISSRVSYKRPLKPSFPRIAPRVQLLSPEPSSHLPSEDESPPDSPTSRYQRILEISKHLELRQERKEKIIKEKFSQYTPVEPKTAPAVKPLTPPIKPIAPIIKKPEKPEPKEQPKEPSIRLEPFIHSPSKEILAKIPSSSKLQSEPLKTVTVINRNPVEYRDLIRVVTEEGSGDAWLNDNAVNAFYSALIMAANEKWAAKHSTNGDQIPGPAFHAFNSGWWSKMSDMNAGYAQVKNWAKRAKIGGPKILQTHILFFPCCLDTMGGGMGGHWILAVAFPRAKEVRVYDSLHSQRPKIQNAIRDYLSQEAGDAFVPEEWEFGSGTTSKQPNASDCGIFTCLNGLALLYSRDPKPLVPTHLRPNGRKMLTGILVNEGFKGEFDLDSFHPGLFTPYVT